MEQKGLEILIFIVFQLMKHCSRSTEEIFGLFISIAFCVDAIKFLVHEFDLDFCFDLVSSVFLLVCLIQQVGVCL